MQVFNYLFLTISVFNFYFKCMKGAPVTFYTVDFQILVFTSASNSTHVLYVMVFVLWYSARESGGGRI